MAKVGKLPDFRYENSLWKRGFRIVAGMDEVGRGCFAGPVVASAVVFAPINNLQLAISNEEGKEIKINDSKKLTERQRNVANEWIRKNALTFGVGEATVSEINKLGIVKATHSAFRRAVAHANMRLRGRIEYLLIDAFFIPYVAGLSSIRKVKKNGRIRKYNHKGTRQLAIVNGDSKIFSVAAASIVAKVYRDQLMKNISLQKPYNKYDWNNNKGYGTKAHCEAILKYGCCRHHRKQFVGTFMRNHAEKT